MKINDQIHIGKLIKKRALQSGIRQIELAERLNTTRQNVSNIYRRDNIDVKMLLKICQILDYNFFNDFIIDNISKTKTDKNFIKLNIEFEINEKEMENFNLKDKIIKLIGK
ncbi:MAG: helix-turn-helix transcriptional regulator [Bacteroidales bacterium]